MTSLTAKGKFSYTNSLNADFSDFYFTNPCHIFPRVGEASRRHRVKLKFTPFVVTISRIGITYERTVWERGENGKKTGDKTKKVMTNYSVLTNDIGDRLREQLNRDKQNISQTQG